MTLLTPHQELVTRRVIAEEEATRRHLVIALSGAHAYGFPSPDSDVDIKSVHIESTRSLLGLGSTRSGFDRLEVIDGVEIDYSSNELRGVLSGVLAGNGNFIERIIGDHLLHISEELAELQEILPRAISRRVHRHYRGFASSQRKAFEGADAPTAKKLLYVLRTALTGTHLLRTGELRVDLTTVADEYGYGDVHELIADKRAGEQAVLSSERAKHWGERLDALFEGLDEAVDRSVLPAVPDPRELEDWLVRTRLADSGDSSCA